MRTILLPVLCLCVSIVSITETTNCEAGEDDHAYESPQQHQLTASLARIDPRFSVTSIMLGSYEERVDDLRLSLAGDHAGFSMRYSRKRKGERLSFYVDHAMKSIPVRLTAGYFVPDFGLGLIYSPLDRIYPFTSGFPIRSYRHFVRRTSFYGDSLRGVALTAGAGNYRMLVFTGQAGKWKDVHYEPGEKEITGVRFEWRKGLTRSGMTLSGTSETRLAGLDIIWKNKDFTAGIETAVDQDRQVSLITGFKRKWRKASAGLRLYGGRYGDISGFDLISSGREHGRRGAAGFLFHLEKRAGRKFRLAAAAGSSIVTTGWEAKRRDDYRIELRWKWMGMKVRAGYSTRLMIEEDMIPFPPVIEKDISTYSTLGILLKGEISRLIGYRASLRFPHGSAGKGRSGTVDLSIGGIDSASRIDLIATLYDAVEGNPAMYVYETVLRGGYPWRQYRGSGARVTLVARIGVAGSFISARLHSTRMGEGGMDLQFLREF